MLMSCQSYRPGECNGKTNANKIYSPGRYRLHVQAFDPLPRAYKRLGEEDRQAPLTANQQLTEKLIGVRSLWPGTTCLLISC